ncbi:hypothetical protein NliqN6_6779 [Naganishia liquefaciens]|uniref:Arylamine N-acetyltransferase n=1 Tax=Naganishia liquefaciens TaxID=104408 RepID=A0A8H3U0C8_9TREE|nr:hypothetical protein NliqN6_6779 [Naganishia liquefaciens]
MSPPTRAASDSDIQSYLRRVHHPLAHDVAALKSDVGQEPLRVLRELMIGHNLFIPFENTFMHCVGTVTSPPLDPASIHSRLVDRHLGGYCYFHGLGISQILLGLGYSCRPVSAYVREGPSSSDASDSVILPERPTHCCVLLDLEDTTYLIDCGFARRGPVTPVALPKTGNPGEAGPIVGSPVLPSETWRITVADLSKLALPKESERRLINPTYILNHRSTGKGQTTDNASWDMLYAITTRTEELEAYEELSWHVCIGNKGVTHKFREYFAVARTYQPGATGPEYPDESNDILPVDFSARLARLSLTNMELSTFENGEKEVLCTFKDEEERLRGLRKWFGLCGPFEGKL